MVKINKFSNASPFLFLIFFLMISFHFTFADDEVKVDHKFYDIKVFGCPTSGSLVEGAIGAVQKGNRHRFYCHSTGPNPGFIGAQTSAKLATIKEQPGVFPAPLMGSDSLQFTFTLTEKGNPVIPVIVKPDGTILRGAPMTDEIESQILSIPYPAQTGIYNFFVLNQNGAQQNQLSLKNPWIKVNIITNRHSRKSQNFLIKTFNSNIESPEDICAEYIY